MRFELHAGLRPATRPDQLRAKWHDGRLLFATGVFVLGTVLAEAIRWLVGANGRTSVFPLLAVLGVGTLGYGLHQQRKSSRRARTAVMVWVWDPGGPAGGEGRIERAVAFSRSRHDLTLQVGIDLTGGATDQALVEQVVARTSKAVEWADRLKAGAARVDLLPVMRLHLAFWLGASFGRAPVAPIALWQPRRGDDGYYLATMLPPAGQPPSNENQADSPFTVCVESFPTVPAVRAALAVSVWHRDKASDERIRAKCRALGVGQLLWLRSKADWQDPDTETVTTALDQVEREWTARLPAAAAEYTVFLDAIVTLAIGIGARLAGTEPERWTALTRDRTGQDGFVQFPPARGGR